MHREALLTPKLTNQDTKRYNFCDGPSGHEGESGNLKTQDEIKTGRSDSLTPFVTAENDII